MKYKLFNLGYYMFFKKKAEQQKIRRCSKCGGIGHDARNCPERNANTPHDTSLWIKYDKITDAQADKMVDWNKKGKRKYLDDTSRATTVKAKEKHLPSAIKKALGGE